MRPPLVVKLSLALTVAACLSLDQTAAFQSHVPPIRDSLRINKNQRQHGSLHSTLAVDAAVNVVGVFWKESPYVAAAMVCGFKASLADFVAQKRAYRKREEKERLAAENVARVALTVGAETHQPCPNTAQTYNTALIYNPDATDNDGNLKVDVPTTAMDKKADRKRNIAYLIYGALYQGVVQEFIYNHVYPRLFGAAATVPSVLTKVFFDIGVHAFFINLPIAYLTKSVIYQYSAKEAMRRYVDDIKNHGLWKKYILLWGPVQCITFGLVPQHLRVTFVACVSFFWLIILSTIASKTKPPSSAAVVIVDDHEEVIEECSFEDGFTCNIDG